MRLYSYMLLALGVCRNVSGWVLAMPTSVYEGGNVNFRVLDPDGTGYSFPYNFTILKRNDQGQDQQISMHYVTETPFFWDNNQPVGSQLRFRIEGTDGYGFTSDYIPVIPNPTFISSASVQSTASAASVARTLTQITTTASTTRTSGASPTPTSLNTNVGALAGGVVGAVLVLAAITAAAFFFICRRQRRRRDDLSEKVDLDAPIPHVVVTPFTYEDTNSRSYGGTALQSEAPLQGGLDTGGSSSHAGSSSYDPSESYAGRNDAPPIYTPPPTSPGSSGIMRGSSRRKGEYAPVSTIPH